MTKADIRTYQKKQRNALTKDKLDHFSDLIRQRLLDDETYQRCTNLFTFISFQTEVDTIKILQQALRDGKRVYVPRVEPHGMEFYEIHNLEGLIESKFGVLEPSVEFDKRFIPEKDVESSHHDLKSIASEHEFHDFGSKVIKNLMLLPGLAFDLNGNRIGYGGGYYDRYLFSHPEAEFYKIAIAFDFQVMELIPAEDFDEKADMLITPTRYIRF